MPQTITRDSQTVLFMSRRFWAADLQAFRTVYGMGIPVGNCSQYTSDNEDHVTFCLTSVHSKVHDTHATDDYLGLTEWPVHVSTVLGSMAAGLSNDTRHGYGDWQMLTGRWVQ